MTGEGDKMTDDVDDTRALKAAHERVKAELREFKSLFKEHPELSSPDDIKALVANNGELIKTRAELRDLQVKHHLTIALMTGRATAEGMDLLGERLAKRVMVETVDGASVLRVMQADGKTHMPGSGADGLAALSDLVKEATQKYPSLFAAENRGGGGATGRSSRNPLGPKKILRSDFDRLSPADRHTKIMKEGFTVVDG